MCLPMQCCDDFCIFIKLQADFLCNGKVVSSWMEGVKLQKMVIIFFLSK